MCNCGKRMQTVLRDGVSFGKLRLLDRWPYDSLRDAWYDPKDPSKMITTKQAQEQHFTSLLRRLGA